MRNCQSKFYSVELWCIRTAMQMSNTCLTRCRVFVAQKFNRESRAKILFFFFFLKLPEHVVDLMHKLHLRPPKHHLSYWQTKLRKRAVRPLACDKVVSTAENRKMENGKNRIKKKKKIELNAHGVSGGRAIKIVRTEFVTENRDERTIPTNERKNRK